MTGKNELYDTSILKWRAVTQADFAGGGAAGTAGTPNASVSTVQGIADGTPVVVGGTSNIVNVTLSLDTSAYASGDVLAETQVVTNAMRVVGGTGVLQSLVAVDEDDQGVAMTVYLLSVTGVMGAENGAPSITDAVARTILGSIDIATTDWKDLGGVRVATLRGLGLLVKSDAASRDLYVAVVNSTGTPTFTASGVRLHLGFLLD